VAFEDSEGKFLKLKEFIEKLSKFDQDLPVCVNDSLTDYYLGPDEAMAEDIGVLKGQYIGKNGECTIGRYLCIG